jgi:hypothetical protein
MNEPQPENDNGYVKFVCVDCGLDVFMFGYCEQTKQCQTCKWIDDINITEEEKENLRKWFRDLGEDA